MAEKKFAIKGRKSERGHLKGRWVSDINFVSQGLLLAIMVVLFLWHGRTWQKQNNGEYIYRDLCYVLDVGFGNDVLPKELQFELIDGNVTSSNQEPILASTAHPDLHYSYFSGKYYAVEAKMEKDWIPKELSSTAHPFYTQVLDFPNEMEDIGLFYYCSSQNAWVWTLNAFHTDIGFSPKVPNETRVDEGCQFGWLMKSPKTEAVRLEDVPTDGWKVYKGGMFDNAAALSVGCITCDTHTDCGGKSRGECVSLTEFYLRNPNEWGELSISDDYSSSNQNLKVCDCITTSAGKYQGDYCNIEPPCDELEATSSTDSFLFHLDNFTGYYRDRPIYLLNPQEPENARVLIYTGRRWVIWVYEDFITPENFTSFGESWYSEQTNSYVPDGNLKWYTTLNETDTMDADDMFRRGIELDLSLQCSNPGERFLLEELDEEL